MMKLPGPYHLSIYYLTQPLLDVAVSISISVAGLAAQKILSILYMMKLPGPYHLSIYYLTQQLFDVADPSCS